MRAWWVAVAAIGACKGDDGGDDGDGGDGGTTDTDPGELTLEEGFEQSLTRLDGCSDLLVYAVDDEDATMLSVQFDHPLEGSGYVDFTDERDLPNPNAQVVVVTGERVSDLTCDDVIDGGGSAVVARWVAGEGHVVLVVDYDETVPGALPLADVTLTDVRFRPPAGVEEAVELASFTWTDVAVGWLPGR
jgi:hypothetical protein